jgi:hypothetical protein
MRQRLQQRASASAATGSKYPQGCARHSMPVAHQRPEIQALLSGLAQFRGVPTGNAELNREVAVVHEGIHGTRAEHQLVPGGITKMGLPPLQDLHQKRGGLGVAASTLTIGGCLTLCQWCGSVGMLLAISTARGVGAETVADALYVNAERTHYFAITHGRSETGPILPRANRAENHAAFTETLGTSALDCSDALYRCVKTGPYVLAVPRRGRDSKAMYKVRGSSFAVKACLEEVGSLCRVALVESDCQVLNINNNADICDTYPRGRKASPRPGTTEPPSAYGVTK